MYSMFCESHATEIPFHAISRLLRGAFGVDELGDEAARARIRDRVSRCGGRGTPPPGRPARHSRPCGAVTGHCARRAQAAAHGSGQRGSRWPARRRLCTSIEDVHWIDEVSESMLADFLVGRSAGRMSLVLITYRPEYRGRAELDARRADDCACPAERFGNRCPHHRAAGPGPIAGRVDDPDRRARPRATRSSPRRSSVTSPTAGCCAASAAHIPVRRCGRGDRACHRPGHYWGTHRPAQNRPASGRSHRRGGDRTAVSTGDFNPNRCRTCPTTNWCGRTDGLR